jgi:hypothetical protein
MTSLTQLKQGDIIGKWTIVGEQYRKNGRLFVKCQCECKNESDVRKDHLRFGGSFKCAECAKQERHSTHRMSKTPQYQIWRGLMARCFNKNEPSYKNYGGRGISVSDEWKKFEQFHSDMGFSPEGKYTLDRIDVNGNYSKENCRWVSWDIQAHNKRAWSKTGHQGVYVVKKDNSFTWEVTRNGKRVRGYARTLNEAVMVRNKHSSIIYAENNK